MTPSMSPPALRGQTRTLLVSRRNGEETVPVASDMFETVTALRYGCSMLRAIFRGTVKTPPAKLREHPKRDSK